jgi:galactoside O-acetyltransferase
LVDFSHVGWRSGVELILGDDVHFAGRLYFEREDSRVTIGSRSYFGSMISVAQSILIGSDVLIAGGGFIADHNSHAIDFPNRQNDVVDWMHGRKDWSRVFISDVTICDKVWVGWAVTILPGVTIGEGAVLAANSVVTKSVQPYTLVAGNPARYVREIDCGELS